MTFVTVSNIFKKQQEGFFLKDVSFSIEQFQKIAVAGETGSGKSTLFKIIAGLIQPNSGEVYFENERVLGPEEKLLPGHSAYCILIATI
jgi:iron(III) transport system ATP-binding protein